MSDTLNYNPALPESRQEVHFPAFRLAAAGLPDQVLVITRLMDRTVTALGRCRQFAPPAEGGNGAIHKPGDYQNLIWQTRSREPEPC
jgi:hypothetical protein